MSRAVKIFGDAALGSLFFEGVPVPPAPLGGVVRAVALDGSTNRIRVFRDDQFQKNGVDPRILFKRMKITRVRDKSDQRLVEDLGYTQQQVIDYINDEANRKANEVDFQRNGSQVGSGNTVNFTGAGVSAVSVSGDVATITIAGNPVTSGIVTGAGSTTLRLTLNDSSNVDIDVTSMRSTTSIGSSTNYFFLNNGAQLANNQHDKDGGVVFYGTKVKRGEELVFPVSSAALHVGIWNGGNGVTGISNVNDRSNWTTKFRYSSDDTRWQNASTNIGKQGVDISTDIETDANTFAVRFDYDSQKLQLWEIDTAFDWHVATANVAVGATETYIYFSSGGSTQTTPPSSLPGITTHRSAEWERQSYANAPVVLPFILVYKMMISGSLPDH